MSPHFFKTLAPGSLYSLQYYSWYNLWWFQYATSSILPCLGQFLIPLLQSPVFYPSRPPTPIVIPYRVSKQAFGAGQFSHVQEYPAQWKTFSISKLPTKCQWQPPSLPPYISLDISVGKQYHSSWELLTQTLALPINIPPYNLKFKSPSLWVPPTSNSLPLLFGLSTILGLHRNL